MEITKKLEDKNVKSVPETVTFICEISLGDRVMEWYKGDRVIKASDKYEIIVNGKVHKLIIHEVDDRDAGDYSAKFKNRTTSAELTVSG